VPRPLPPQLDSAAFEKVGDDGRVLTVEHLELRTEHWRENGEELFLVKQIVPVSLLKVIFDSKLKLLRNVFEFHVVDDLENKFKIRP